MNQGIISIVVDTPEGKLTLTKEEARKLYETLHDLFGDKSYPSYPSAPPSYPIPREYIPSVPGDWPKPAPIWCGDTTQDTPSARPNGWSGAPAGVYTPCPSQVPPPPAPPAAPTCRVIPES